MKQVRLRNVWLGLSIRSKLILILGSIILLTTLVNSYSLSSIFLFLNAYERDLSKTAAVYALQSETDTLHSLFESRISLGNTSDNELFSRSNQLVWSRWYNVQALVPQSLETQFQIQAFRFGYQAYVVGAEQALLLQSQGEDFIPTLIRVRRIHSYLRNYIQSLLRLRLSESSALLESQNLVVRRTQLISFSTLAIFALSLMSIGSAFAKSLSTPIQQLAFRAQKIAEGDLTTQDLTTQYQDEIGTLTKAFNTMNQNINEMVERLKEKVEIEKLFFEDERKIMEMNQSLREAQFLNLQSQMSPHFFFNTLNTISRMSMFEKAPETLKLIESLSFIFRYTLQQGANLCTLDQELLLLKEYLHIQSIRFSERLKPTIHLDPEVEAHRFLIPPFTIQPLVENSIKYALEPKEDSTHIHISLTTLNKDVMNLTTSRSQIEKTSGDFGNTYLCILITDDGPGITPERLEEVLNVPRVATISGIGIKNVQQRIALSYGGLGTFSISCPPNGGTTIEITLPESIT